jgi:hypothetical protein
MRIKYEFVNGEVTEFEVSDKYREVMAAIDKDTYNNNQKETRRHKSYSEDNDKLKILIDNSVDVEAEVERNFKHKTLYLAISELQPHQKELALRVFFEGEKIVAVTTQ